MSAPSAPNIFIRPRVYPGEIRFYWRPPTSDGGSPVLKYTLACASLAYSQDLSANVANFLVTGLTDRIDYTFTITATNAIGTGPAATFRTVQTGTIPFGPTLATVSTLNTSTTLVTWNLSTIATESQPKWFVITTFPSTPTLSSFKKCAYIYERARTFQVPSTNIFYQYLVQAVSDSGYCPPFAYTSTIGAGTEITLFSPSSIAGNIFWIDADNAASITRTGTTVTNWRDRMGNINLTVGGGTTVYTSNVFGTKPSLLFSNSWLLTSSNAMSTTNNVFNINMFTVHRPTAAGAGGGFGNLGAIVFATNGYTKAGINQNGSNVQQHVRRTSGAARFDGPLYPSRTSSNYILNARINYSTGTTQLNVNGTENATSSFGGTASTSAEASLFNIGSDTFNSAYYGYISEYIIYNTAITPFDGQKVEGYLAWKWGLQSNLPVIHPFRNTAPTPTSVFSPSNFNGLALWLDASQLTGLSNGQALTTWADRSPNNFSNVATGGPTYRTNTLNGLPVIRFNGSSQYVNFGTSTMNIRTSTFHAFIAARYSTTNTISIILAKGLAGGGTSRYYLGKGSGTTNDFFLQNEGIINVTTPFTSSNPTLFGYYWDRATMFNRINGSTVATSGNTSAQDMNTPYNFLVGAYNNDSGGVPPSFYFAGDIAEVLIYTSPLGTNDRLTVEGYMAWKWGLQTNLPLSHPYRNSNPGVI